MSYSKFLESKGLKVWCKGNELRVTPPEKITPDIAEFIKTHKPEIMAKLKGDTTTPAIWHNPYPQGTPEAREESLLQCMGQTPEGLVKAPVRKSWVKTKYVIESCQD